MASYYALTRDLKGELSDSFGNIAIGRLTLQNAISVNLSKESGFSYPDIEIHL